jgi:hypothetical protein
VASITSWAWYAAGWALIALGAWPLLTGRRTWRRRNGRLCRKCVYDMAGVPGLTCPECGRTAKNERELIHHPPLRRWRLAGLALLTIGWGLVKTPVVSEFGWAAALPDWAVALFAPTDAPSDAQWLARSAGTPQPATIFSMIPFDNLGPVRSPSERLRDQVYLDAWRRLNTGAMPDSLARLYLRRVIAGCPDLAPANPPRAWPSDVTLPSSVVPFRDSSAPGQLYTRFEVDLSTRTGVERIVEALVPGHAYELERTRLPIDATRPSETFIIPVTSPALDKEVGALLDPRALIYQDTFFVEFRARTADPEWARMPKYLDIYVRILLDGEEIGAGVCDMSYVPPAYGRGLYASVLWNDDGHEQALAHPERIELELSGDGPGALAAFFRDPTGEPKAWAGSTLVKPRVVRR